MKDRPKFSKDSKKQFEVTAGGTSDANFELANRCFDARQSNFADRNERLLSAKTNCLLEINLC